MAVFQGKVKGINHQGHEVTGSKPIQPGLLLSSVSRAAYYLVLPASTFSFSAAPACAAASLAVSTRKGEQAT
jgi:hypothetical protein